MTFPPTQQIFRNIIKLIKKVSGKICKMQPDFQCLKTCKTKQQKMELQQLLRQAAFVGIWASFPEYHVILDD